MWREEHYEYDKVQCPKLMFYFEHPPGARLLKTLHPDFFAMHPPNMQ